MAPKVRYGVMDQSRTDFRSNIFPGPAAVQAAEHGVTRVPAVHGRHHHGLRVGCVYGQPGVAEAAGSAARCRSKTDVFVSYFQTAPPLMPFGPGACRHRSGTWNRQRRSPPDAAAGQWADRGQPARSRRCQRCGTGPARPAKQQHKRLGLAVPRVPLAAVEQLEGSPQLRECHPARTRQRGTSPLWPKLRTGVGAFPQAVMARSHDTGHCHCWGLPPGAPRRSDRLHCRPS